MTRGTAAISLVSALILGCWTSPGCGEGPPPEVPTRDPEPVLSWATQQQFGEVDPTAVVATVNGNHVTVVDLAICLEAAPARTVEECLDEHIDAVLAGERAVPDDWIRPDLHDARTSAQASVLLRELIDRPIAPGTLSDADISAFLDDPNNRLLFGAPELRRCSHLLVRDREGASDGTRALALEARRLLDDVAGSARLDDLHRARRAIADRANAAGYNARVEERFWVRPDNPEPDAEDPWPGLPIMAQTFADVLFELPAPGALSEPFDTRFGTHVVLLEMIQPAQTMSSDAAELLARDELSQRRRATAFGQLVTEVLEQSEVIRTNAIEIFRLDDEAIIRERNASIRQTLGEQSSAP